MDEPHALVAAAALAAIPATIAAVAALRGGRVGRQNQQSLDTGNEKDIGTTVHDVAQTVEIVAAQSHTNAAELMGLRQEHQELHQVFREHLDNVAVIMDQHAKVWEHMEAVYKAASEPPKAPRAKQTRERGK